MIGVAVAVGGIAVGWLPMALHAANIATIPIKHRVRRTDFVLMMLPPSHAVISLAHILPQALIFYSSDSPFGSTIRIDREPTLLFRILTSTSS